MRDDRIRLTGSPATSFCWPRLLCDSSLLILRVRSSSRVIPLGAERFQGTNVPVELDAASWVIYTYGRTRGKICGPECTAGRHPRSGGERDDWTNDRTGDRTKDGTDHRANDQTGNSEMGSR